ncbi:MAG: UDP-2,4-diacetamido-2,4,6-trideoxy-beta-L-altropyranose hydrolase, partial [Candidatus Omnitrophota bacterium]
GSIMITFGGDDMRNMTPKILGFLRENYPELKKNVIVGNAFQNIDEIKKSADKNTNLIYYPDAKKIKEIMLESDIAISAGGQTLYELARVGVPTVGICVAENQLRNVKGWERIGFLEYVGWYNKNDVLEKIKDAVEYLKNVKTRESKSKIAKKFIDGKGSLRIVDKVIRE